jgi:hypothetical protein
VVLPMANGPIPASTVRWAIQLASPDQVWAAVPDGLDAGLITPFDADKQWVWYEARTVQCADGYATAYASMFAEGRLLAWSEQLITVYDRPAAEAPAEAEPAMAESAEAESVEVVPPGASA